MNNQKLSKDNILIYLEDLGLDQEMIDLYLKSEYAHDLKSQIQILRKHRCILIEKIHKDQRQIEDLDCLMYSLTKKGAILIDERINEKYKYDCILKLLILKGEQYEKNKYYFNLFYPNELCYCDDSLCV